jgi:hypothetical protein
MRPIFSRSGTFFEMGELIVFDPRTGEVAGSVQATIKPRGKRTITMMYGPNWMAFPVSAGQRLARCNLSGNSYRLFWLRPSDIVKTSGISRSQVYASLKELREAEIIVERQPYGYRLHPEFGWRGDPTNKVAKRNDGRLVLVELEDVR